MNVRLTTEVSKYIMIATLSTKLKNGRPYQKSYEEQRAGEKTNLAEVKALLLGCRHLNQNQDFTLELDIKSAYIQASVRSLEKWQQSDWKNAKGKTITYKQQWQEIYELIKKYDVKIINEEETQ